MLDIGSMWMVKLSERLTLPIQYIAETIIEDYWGEVCLKKGMSVMLSSSAMSLFVSTIHSSLALHHSFFFVFTLFLLYLKIVESALQKVILNPCH